MGAAVVALIVALGVLGFATGTAAGALSPKDRPAAEAAFKAIQAGDWKAARRLADGAADPLVGKIVRWLDYTRADGGGGFEEISTFIAENPHWPNQTLLQRRAEEAMPASLSEGAVLAWFKDRQPASTDGLIRYGAALLASGDAERGRAVLREAWINANFGGLQERTFYKHFRKLLTAEDHWRRLDRLLWDGRLGPARAMLSKVDPGRRALAEARIILTTNTGGVERALRRIPAELRNDSGLVYERLRWRRRKGLDGPARELLDGAPPNLVRPEKWWNERAILARRALQDGHVSEAYRMARAHGLAEGADLAEAEWLAGWIALRFLGDARDARGHFVAMFKAVNFPVSLARGAYWAGRAAEALKDQTAAEAWYRTAARHPASYYGQLAAVRLEPGRAFSLPAEPLPAPAEFEAFDSHELAGAARILSELGEVDRLRPFVLALSAISESPGWYALTAALARARGRPDVAIAVAKRANRAGSHVVHAGYPTLDPPAAAAISGHNGVEMPLVLAVIRQESAFAPEAESPAGAKGLMQLLPATARGVAKELNVPYSPENLIRDPDLNVRLGQSYLRALIEDFAGSYVLALAAYNAGPARARAWMRANGDPRDPAVDVVDWIEMIPFEETRNYVQRVMENLQVYRGRLNETEVALTPEPDRRR